MNIYNRNFGSIQGLVLFILIILSFFSTVISLGDSNKIIYLPLILCYTLGYLIYIAIVKRKRSVVHYIIIITYFIRMVLYPLIVILPDYQFPNINNQVESNIQFSILLQIYEFIFVISALIFSRNMKNKNIDGTRSNTIVNIDNTHRIRHIIITLSFIGVLLVIVYPQLLSIFQPVFFFTEESQNNWVINEKIAIQSIPPLLYYLSTWVLRILRILLVYWVIMVIKINLPETKRNFFKILLSILSVLTLMLITTNDRASGIFSSIAMILLLTRMYLRQAKMLLKYLVSIISVGALLLLVILPKFKGGSASMFNDSTNAFYFLNQKINAYFSGTINISAALSMPRDEILLYLKGDLLRIVPIVRGFFTEYDLSNTLFNQVLGFDTIYFSQIIPNIGQGYYYFGFILAPLFSVILIRLAIKAEKKANFCNDSLGYFAYNYLSIYLAVSPIFYNMQLIMYLILLNVVPIIVMFELFKYRKKSKVLM